MRIAIVTMGTRGDVQPYLALGVGLRKAGHDVIICTTREFEPFISSHDLHYAPFAGDIRTMMAESDIMEQGTNMIGFLSTGMKTIEPQMRQMAHDVIASGKDSDLIIANLLTIYWAEIASTLYDVPFAASYLQPTFPTHDEPGIFLPSLPQWIPDSVRRAYNYHSSTFLLDVMWKLIGRPVNKVRREEFNLSNTVPSEGMGKVRTGESMLLYGYSPTVVPPYSDHTPSMHVTGYWFLDAAQEYQPPAALVQFLEAGPAPIYIGFGSMTDRKAEDLTRIALDALEKSGQRGLLLSGWGGIGKMHIPDNVFVIDSAPHDWLFPRMAAVVHHGGAGTTAAGVRAGVPSVIVPFIADQPYWGQRVHDLGVGPKPIPRRALTVDKLAAAIRATTDSQMRARAAALGERIRAEDGIGHAIEIIEAFIKQHKKTSV